MPHRHIPFRTTATACLLAVLVCIAGPLVADAKILISPTLSTDNAEDGFVCSFQNVHTSKAANISYIIFDLASDTVVAEELVTLDPSSVYQNAVAGPGWFICLFQSKGGTVRGFVSLNANGRSDEMQPIPTK